MDRVWISEDGRAKLLDFPAPGLAAGADSNETSPLPASLPPARFLGAVARAALESVPASSPIAGERTEPAVPLPLSARSFLSKLAENPPAGLVLERLRLLVQQPAAVSRKRRMAVLAGCAFFPILAALATWFGTRALETLNRQQPGIWELNQLLSLRSAQRMPWARPSAVNDRIFEIYIASHYRATITNADRWLTIYALSMVPGEGRQFAQRSVADYPRPTGEQIDEAEAALAPMLNQMHTFNVSQQPWFPLVAGGVSGLVYVAFPALLAALLFRGGLLLRALRIGVARLDGRPASRLRVFWRALLSWSPMMAGPVAVAFLTPVLGLSAAIALVAGLVAALALASALCLERGLQDRLSSTVLVMR